jgi:DNA polymerase-1
MDWLSFFKNIWFVDFEFCQPEGERPDVVCMVARELFTGRLLRRWRDELEAPPFDIGPESLFVAFYSSAEWGCHLALGWPMPTRILDLYAEFRCITSGLNRPNGSGLLGALSYFGLDALDAVEKDAMRQLVIRGGPWTDDEKRSILDYCQSDVDSLVLLFPSQPQLVLQPR